MNQQSRPLSHDGNHIRSLRLQRGWSQSHLAELTSLGERTIQRIESTGQASLESRMAIAQAFDLTTDQLFQTAPARELTGHPGRSRYRLVSGLSVLGCLLVIGVLVLGANPSIAEPL